MRISDTGVRYAWMKNLRISWSAGVFGMRTDDPYYTTVVGAANRIFAVDEWIHPVFLSENFI